MRILFFLHNQGYEGSLLSFFSLADGLIGKEVELHAIVSHTLISNEDFVNEAKNKKINLIEAILPLSIVKKDENNLLKKILFRLKCFFSILISILKLLEIVKNVHPDIIHTNSGVLHQGFFISKILKIPHVWHLREYQDKDFNFKILPSKRLFEVMLKHSNVISISDDIVRHFGLICNDKVHTIYNGVYKRNERVFIEKKKSYFLMASRISEEKCHEDVIRAFNDFLKKYPFYKLIIAGEGSLLYINQLNKLIDNLCLEQSVLFVGFCEKSKIKDLMSESKALIVASRSEGFGRMTVEAMFNGSMVIGRNSGGTLEVLKKMGGILYDGSLSELTKAMCAVHEMTNDEYTANILNSQNKVQAMCSVESYSSSVYNVYTNLIN